MARLARRLSPMGGSTPRRFIATDRRFGPCSDPSCSIEPVMSSRSAAELASTRQRSPRKLRTSRGGRATLMQSISPASRHGARIQSLPICASRCALICWIPAGPSAAVVLGLLRRNPVHQRPAHLAMAGFAASLRRRCSPSNHRWAAVYLWPVHEGRGAHRSKQRCLRCRTTQGQSPVGRPRYRRPARGC